MEAKKDAKRAKRGGKTAEQLPGELSKLVIVELLEVLVWPVRLQQGEKVQGIEKENAGQLPTDALSYLQFVCGINAAQPQYCFTEHGRALCFLVHCIYPDVSSDTESFKCGVMHASDSAANSIVFGEHRSLHNILLAIRPPLPHQV